MQSTTRWTSVCAAAALWSCTASHDVEGYGLAIEPSLEAPGAALSGDCKKQIEDSLDKLPDDLGCTGLYAGTLKSKTVAANVHRFTPANALWSDGAEKTRWFSLPSGTTIDARQPNAWVFPTGTKLWKEFQVHGKRIETRLFEKIASDRWAHAAYEWNADETSAKRGGAHDIMVDGEPYHVPTSQECEDCHKGRAERVLGLEQVSLGLPMDDPNRGVTLDELVAKKLISGLQGGTHLQIGDDGTGLAAETFGWLHINCGVTCHNDNSNSMAYGRGMRLRLDPTQLDGRSSREFEIFKTTVGQNATTLRWNEQARIVAGAPDQSLLYTLITHRGNKQEQMPPIGSRIVDETHAKIVADWISALNVNSGPAPK